MLIQHALKLATASLREIADEAGVNYASARAWAAGIRNPSPEAAQKIAATLRTRAARLRELADDMEGRD